MASEGEGISQRSPASAFTVAERLLAGITLTVYQTAQLRAIDHTYQQSLFRMLAGARRAPTAAEQSQLDEVAARDIMNMLTAEQRRCLDARRSSGPR